MLFEIIKEPPEDLIPVEGDAALANQGSAGDRTKIKHGPNPPWVYPEQHGHILDGQCFGQGSILCSAFRHAPPLLKELCQKTRVLCCKPRTRAYRSVFICDLPTDAGFCLINLDPKETLHLVTFANYKSSGK